MADDRTRLQRLAEIGIQGSSIDLAIDTAIDQLAALKKPLFELDEEAALRSVIAQLTARASDLGEDALLLGYLIGAAIKNYRQGHR